MNGKVGFIMLETLPPHLIFQPKK